MSLINSKILSDIPNIHHGFGVRGIDVANYLDELGIKDRFIFNTNQMHGDCVHCLLRPRKGGTLKGDAFITDRPGLVCFVRTADCVPVLVADKKRRVVAAVHAGWRGTALNVVCKTITSMTSVFGSEPKDCVAAIGPRICKDCYEVGEDVFKEVCHFETSTTRSFAGAQDDSGAQDDIKFHIDLGEINRQHLINLGLAKSNIDVLNECTYCNEIFASYRRDKSETERQFNFIVIT